MRSNGNLEELLTQKRLAERLNQSERTLERWRVEGTGPVYVKAGRKVLYIQQDVEDWLLATRRQSTSDVTTALGTHSGVPRQGAR